MVPDQALTPLFPQPEGRALRAEVDLGRIQRNAVRLKEASGGKGIWAVLKANAYGHGSLPVARALTGLVHGFAISSLEEALELRDGGITGEILVLGGLRAEALPRASALGLTVAIVGPESLEAYGRILPDHPVKLQLKVDTGMGRFGLLPSELSECLPVIHPLAPWIGGAMAHQLFRAKVHIGYLAAIVAASNAGGAGSVVGDTTTTMMWIAGVSPFQVMPAYVAAVTAEQQGDEIGRHLDRAPRQDPRAGAGEPAARSQPGGDRHELAQHGEIGGHEHCVVPRKWSGWRPRAFAPRPHTPFLERFRNAPRSPYSSPASTGTRCRSAAATALLLELSSENSPQNGGHGTLNSRTIPSVMSAPTGFTPTRTIAYCFASSSAW